MITSKKRWITHTMTLVICFLYMGVCAAEKLNLKTLCPVSGNKGQVILLIDTTDPLTAVAQERLKELIKGFTDADNEYYLQRAHELIVYHLSPEVTNVNKPVSRVCNPGNPKDRTRMDDLLNSSTEAKRRWQAFVRRLQALTRRIHEQVLGPKSPLLESIAVVTARHIPTLGVGQKRKPVRLLLFSDMLQNSARLSHYKSLPEMKKFKSLVGYSEMDSDLSGVDVWLFYVRRTDLESVQTPQHYYWWTQAIELFGGQVQKQIPL